MQFNKIKPLAIFIAISAICINDMSSQSIINNPEFLNSFEYRCIGPTRGGRVTAVAGVASQPNTYYMGATGGGIWKTEDSGNTWKNISDGFFSTPSTGAITVAQNNPDRIYVGTGTDGIRSNVIIGKGVYRSDNAGKKWQHVGLDNAGQIGAVIIHPTHDDTVYVAAIGNPFAPTADRGVYRSYNAGDNWEKVLFISDSTGAVDLEFHPTNPNVIYAASWQVERKPWTIISGGKQGGMYRSDDGGNQWKKLAGGLPTGLIGKIDLAVSPADPDRIIALVEAPVGKGGIYISYDRGEKFELVTQKKELLDRPFYYCNIDANPQNANTLYVNATRFWKSTDNGKKWKSIRTPHGDNHDMWIHPNDSLSFIQGNDGGGNITHNGGVSWSAIDNQPTAELYQVEVDDQIPYWLYAGQQDNSTISLPSQLPFNPTGGMKTFWSAVGGCETGPAVPKPGNPNIVYSNCKGRFGVFNKKTGQEMQYYVGASNMYGHNPADLKFRFQRVSPIHVSPHDADKVYHASQYVHVTRDDGKSWETISPDLTAFEKDKQVISGFPITRDITGEEFYSTIYAIRESKIQQGQIWVGANDGPVHVTMDDGASWQNVTPRSLPSNGRIDCVEPSPHKANKAYFTSLRYQLNDWKPYIYKTEDNGKSWKLITNGIPDGYPVRVVREDPEVEGLLFAGTEFGMYISFDDGNQWQPFQQNLPVTPITDIQIFRKNLNISTMGRSFWILDDLTPLHAALKDRNLSKVHLFDAPDTYMLRYRGTGKSAVPSYPSPGVSISYYLPDSLQDQMVIEILDPSDKPIRKFTTKGKEVDEANSEADMATGFRRQGTNTQLKSTPGLHRFQWDMRHFGAWDKKTPEGAPGGPRVSPGKYTLKMRVGDITQKQSFELMMDPRLVESGVTTADLKAQEKLALQIRDLMSQTKKLDQFIADESKMIEQKLADKPGHKKSLEKKELLEKVKNEITTPEGRYMQPMLIDQIRYLASMLNRAEQRPGKDAFDRIEELKLIQQQLSKQVKYRMGS